jgi:hypothetical protein
MAAQQHIVSFSTGLSSALTVERVLARYGRHNTEIVFMNTYIEDEDNHRFMNDCATRWGIDIITLADGRTPYQVAEDEQIIPNQKVAPCTFKLKIELFRAYLQSKDNSPLTVHIGYDYTEVHRCKTTRDAYRKYGWHIDFPLLWKPYELRNYADVVRQDWGVEPPRTYGLGFTHANCLQWGCVKMGQADWMRLLLNFPDRYARTEAWEQRMRKHPKRQNYAIMRDQSNFSAALRITVSYTAAFVQFGS